MQIPSSNKFLLNPRVAGVLLVITLLFCFASIWLVFITSNRIPDEKIFDAIAPHISESRIYFMNGISFLGNHRFLIPANLLLIAFFTFKKDKWSALTVAAVELTSLGLMSLLKNLIGRHRPMNPLLDGVTNFSFPSGHAFMSLAFYGLLACWVATGIKNNWNKGLVISFLLLLTLLIGFSRIYLRLHYTTDVIAGLSIGTIWLIFCLWLISKIKNASGLVPKQ